jgi:nucleotide-binding universal stress UspA family protein
MKIMVCYDATAASKNTVREAQRHAEIWHATIEVIAAVMRKEPIRRARLEEMEEQLESDIRELFEDFDIPYTAQLQIDDIEIGKKIVKLAERKKVDLIFIGIEKHSKIRKRQLDATVQYIILNASCAVVTVK